MAPKILVVDDNQELLSLLTALLEDAGYEVIAAAKGKDALDAVKQQAPRCAVLDILLPDMMGYHLAEMLRKSQPELPLIFITGVFKGGKHAIEARSKYGAAAYFEKPFEAEKLLEAVGAVVPSQKRPGQETSAAAAAAAFEVELDIDVEEDVPAETMELTGRIKVTGGDNISAELRGANLTASAPVKTAGTFVRPPTADRPKSQLPPSSEPGQRRGELHDNLPALINAFYLSRETGELGIQRGKVKKIVYFEKGQPVFALSNLLTDRFGQFLVRVGKIPAETLQDAAAFANETRRRTGDVLIERGLLKDTERLYYVGQQVKAIIYSLFAWEQGTYVMTFRESARAESIKLDIHPANLIIRGVKKLYKPDRLKRLLPMEERLMPSLQPAYQLNEIELERWEADLMPKIDGNRTVSELIAASGRPEHVVVASLRALLDITVLERRV